MMAQEIPPAAPRQARRPRHDPFSIRSFEQLLALFDGGAFLEQMMADHRQLQRDLMEYLAEHGPKGCTGTMTLTISYAPGRTGDVGMTARAEFKAPRKPPASAAAYLDDDGNMTLFSPLMSRMQAPRDVTDVADHDPETGEIRDL